MFLVVIFFVFFFKQKTAYEMRISDWSSDVCSSDLIAVGLVWDKAFATSSNFRQAAGAECQHDLVERRQREFELAYVGNHPILVFDGFRIVDWIAIAIELLPIDTADFALFVGLFDDFMRPEGRSVGKAWVRTCRSRWSPHPSKKTDSHSTRLLHSSHSQ